MNEQQFKERTKQAGLRVVRLVESLPRTRTAEIVGRQLLRSGTSIGANYRAACRAISTPDMTAKLGDVEEEADESMYWIEILIEAGVVPPKKVEALHAELNEILAMVVASIRTLRSRNPKSAVRPTGGAIQNPKSKIQNR